VVVTGGSRGLGAAISTGRARRGARVVVASRKLAACAELATAIVEAGGQAHPIACHVGDWESLISGVDAAASHWGRLDGLVNNAGMSPLAPSLLETSETLFDKVIGVNLKGPTRLMALAERAMAESGGGSIVNISSLASIKPTPIAAVYSAAEAGLNALTTARPSSTPTRAFASTASPVTRSTPMRRRASSATQTYCPTLCAPSRSDVWAGLTKSWEPRSICSPTHRATPPDR
jgi:NAD(P)-dependent dehydrogenase (short-subunit alcohol dehydrogenase family)